MEHGIGDCVTPIENEPLVRGTAIKDLQQPVLAEVVDSLSESGMLNAQVGRPGFLTAHGEPSESHPWLGPKTTHADELKDLKLSEIQSVLPSPSIGDCQGQV